MIPVFDTFSILFLSAVLILAAIHDIRVQKIPNALTYLTMIAALAYHGVTGGIEGFLFSAKGLGLGVAILILPYLMGGMGAGDAKLMGAVGAVLGPKGVFIAFLFTAIFGGVYALTLLLAHRENLKGWIMRWGTMLTTFLYLRQFIYIPSNNSNNRLKLYYGLAIAAGTISSIFWRVSGHEFPI
jgi:prepilin peptidase CpaA